MTPNFATSALYALDNLEVMRGMDSETVPLIYADPPFNSKRMYQGMSGTKARAHRFRDTWSWNDAKEEWLDQLENDHPKLRRLVQTAKDHSDGMGGYICFMAPRIIEMHRILTPDGSLYLHCDPHANSYLRLLLDLVFGAKNFRNEIVWRKYSGRKNNATRKFATQQDTILLYCKTPGSKFNVLYKPISDSEIAKEYKFTDENGRRYRKSRGRRYQLTGEERRLYLDEQPGSAIGSLWVEDKIQLNTSASERTGWKTQKPLALLERVIKAGSNEGDIVFDPFCGCGTALVAAEKLGRRWVGADDDQNAVEVIRARLSDGRQVEVAPASVSVLHRPPARTEADTAAAGGVLKDPTGYIIPKMPSDQMSNAAIREQLLEWQGNAAGIILCPGCGELLKARHFHLDHINPKSAGGANRIDNRILLCGACNTDKGNTKALPQLWNEQKIRGKKRQEMQKHITEIQNKARALVQLLDAGAPVQPRMP